MIFQSYIRKWSISREGGEKEKVTREVGEVSLFLSFPLTLWHEAFVPGKPTHNLLGVPLCESTCVCRRVCVWLYVEQGQVRHCMDSQISRATRKQKNSAYRVAEHLFYNFFSYWWKNKISSWVAFKSQSQSCAWGGLRQRQEVWRGGGESVARVTGKRVVYTPMPWIYMPAGGKYTHTYINKHIEYIYYAIYLASSTIYAGCASSCRIFKRLAKFNIRQA